VRTIVSYIEARPNRENEDFQSNSQKGGREVGLVKVRAAKRGSTISSGFLTASQLGVPAGRSTAPGASSLTDCCRLMPRNRASVRIIHQKWVRFVIRWPVHDCAVFQSALAWYFLEFTILRTPSSLAEIHLPVYQGVYRELAPRPSRLLRFVAF
jgi:hypothetical protein